MSTYIARILIATKLFDALQVVAPRSFTFNVHVTLGGASPTSSTRPPSPPYRPSTLQVTICTLSSLSIGISALPPKLYTIMSLTPWKLGHQLNRRCTPFTTTPRFVKLSIAPAVVPECADEEYVNEPGRTPGCSIEDVVSVLPVQPTRKIHKTLHKTLVLGT